MTKLTPSPLQVAAMLIAFIGLTAIGVWWAAPSADAIGRTWHELLGLGVASVCVLVLLAGAVIPAEVVRFVVIGRAIGVRVGLRAAIDATIASNLMTWISPAGSLGEPAAVYLLGRRGVPWDAGLVICFGKFATSFAFIMGLGCVLLALGFGPHLAGWAIVSIAVTIGIGVVLIGVLVVAAAWPAAAMARIDRVEARLARRFPRASAACANATRGAIDRLARFRRGGFRGSLAIAATHVVYYGAYAGLLVTLAAMFGARSIVDVVPLAIIYQAFTYLAPAPGIAEAGAAAFFGGLLPDGGAFAVVLLFRAFTAYLHVALGLLYVPALVRKRVGPETHERRDGSDHEQL